MRLTAEVGGTGRARAWLAGGVVALLVIVAIALVFEAGPGSSTAGVGGRSIRVDRVYLDRVDAPAGMAYYLTEVNASNLGSAAWHFDPSHLVAVSNSSASYHPAPGYNVTSLLGRADLAEGEHAVGFAAFEMPSGQGLSKLSYEDSAGGESLQVGEVPPVSGVATRFDPSVHFVLNGTSWANTIETWGAITNQTNGLSSFGGEEPYRNNTFVFFTGEKIGVTFFFDYFKRPMDPATIFVQSIVSDDGLGVSSEVGLETTFGFAGYNQPHPLPVNMTGYGSNASVDLVVMVPPGHPSGVLHFTIEFSG